MYGKGIKCDKCGKTEVIDSWSERITDVGVEGWIRMAVNKPIKYSFMQEKQATTAEQVDLCSIGCAQTYLWAVAETIPEDEQ